MSYQSVDEYRTSQDLRNGMAWQPLVRVFQRPVTHTLINDLGKWLRALSRAMFNKGLNNKRFYPQPTMSTQSMMVLALLSSTVAKKIAANCIHSSKQDFATRVLNLPWSELRLQGDTQSDDATIRVAEALITAFANDPAFDEASQEFRALGVHWPATEDQKRAAKGLMRLATQSPVIWDTIDPVDIVNAFDVYEILR